MRRYSEAVKVDVRRRMGPRHRQSVAEISKELGIHVITLYKWRRIGGCRERWCRQWHLVMAKLRTAPRTCCS